VIQTFRDRDARAIFEGRLVRRYRAIARQARKRLVVLDAATSLKDLAALPGNRLHPLRAGREGQYAVRVNDQWRIAFRWGPQGPEDVEIVDYH
jgi:proteic killer suppression protein